MRDPLGHAFLDSISVVIQLIISEHQLTNTRPGTRSAVSHTSSAHYYKVLCDGLVLTEFRTIQID